MKNWNWDFKKSIAFNQYSFFVVVLSSTDLCVHWSVLIHLYDDDTIQVSILYVKFTVEWWYEILIAI
jgi:hypothetical protein